MKARMFIVLLIGGLLSGCFATYGGKDSSSEEGQLISYQYKYDGKTDLKTEAVLRTPPSVTQSDKLPAVIVLHDGGGWSTGRTRQYADLLSINRYVTLEPRLYYDEKTPRTYKKDLASVYGALAYLAQLPSVDKSRIYILGMSAGAMLGILAKTKMANEALNGSGTQFKAIASLYPVCWSFSATLDGKAPGFFSDFTPADLSNWQSTPIRLFVPQLDDYDDRDPKTCENFIAKIPSEQVRMSFSLKLYSNATHGWDHGKTYSFNTGAACKGRGCVNTNQSNPAVTQQGYKDVVEFFKSNP